MTKQFVFSIFASLLSLICLSCPSGGDGSENNGTNTSTVDERATITFWNESSYEVDIYKGFNPEYFDETVWLCRVDAQTREKKVLVYASSDQVMGDTFFLRYKRSLPPLENPNGISTIPPVDAKSDLSNIRFVVEKNKTYPKTIPQPGQLQFANGYVKIQNQGPYQIEIRNGGIPLHQLGNDSIYLASGYMAYYEIKFNRFDDTEITINHLESFGTSTVNFPSFSMERGKLYSFTVNGSTITGPTVMPLSIN
ncbi:hypothetical protein AGMMS49944_19840 [Spirochaetia bacterium]|nr:hypothetical protein AGMMS49944_19840 [Spirochaetia bacterium]